MNIHFFGVSWFKYIYFKIINILGYECWQLFKNDSIDCYLSFPIEIDKIFTIIFLNSEIIVVYNDKTNEKLFSTPFNLKVGHKILNNLELKRNSLSKLDKLA